MMLIEPDAARCVRLCHPGRRERRFPGIAGAAIRRGQGGEPLRCFDQPRGEIGAFEVAAHPVEVGGGAA